MAHKTPVSQSSETIYYATQAQVDAGSFDNLSGGRIYITNAGVLTGVVYEVGASGSAPVASGGSSGAAVAAGQVTQVNASNARVQFTQAILDAGGPMVHLNDGVTGIDLVSADWTANRFFHMVNVTTSATIPVTVGAGWTRARSDKLDLAATTGDILELAPGEWALVQMSNGYLNVKTPGGGSTVRTAWTANTRYEKGDIVYVATAQGTMGIGDPIIRIASGKSAATFTTTEAAKWTELAEDPDLAPRASPTFTGTVIVDGAVKLGDGQNLGDSGSPVASATTVFPNVASTASTTIATTDTAMRVARAGTSGSKWPNAMDVNIGSHTAGLNSQTQVDFRLANGAQATPDTTVLTLKGDGAVLANGSQVVRQADVNNTLTSTSTTAPLSAAQGKALQDTKAPLASPALTGTPTVPTASVGTNTTQAASTAFVQAEIAADLATATPLVDGTAAVGVSTKMAREDHVHPSDTARQARFVYTSTQDANNLTAAGVHVSGNGAGSLTNGPSGNTAWSVVVSAMVSGANTYIHQLFSTDNNDMYTRKRDNGTTWSTWTKVLNGTIQQSDVIGLSADLLAKPNIDDSSSTSTANAWSVSKTKTYVDGKVAQTTNYQTFNDADSPAAATLDSTNQDAVGQPTLSAVGPVVTGSAFVSNIAETHASTKWIINGVVGSADTANKTSRTIAPSEAPAGTDLGGAIPIRAAYIDSNNNQSRRAVAVNASISEVTMASTWTDSAYPVATGSTFKFNHAQLDLFAINVKAGFFVDAKMQGGSQPTEAVLALIANTLNVGTANQVQFWLGFYDGSTFTKALKIRLTDDGTGNMTVNVLEGAHWNGNVLASASWTTSGGEPAGKNPAGDQGVAVSSVGAGYGLNNLTVKFQQ